MAVRVAKTGAGGGVEFTQGTQPLHVAELDGDLDALFNGGITDSNIAPTAGIATSKLASDNGIIAAMLASNSVTTAKIVDLNVTTAKIADFNVTIGKLAVGASVNPAGTGNAPFTDNLLTVGTTEFTFGTLGITTRGGRVLLLGTLAGSIMHGTTPAEMTFRLKRGATEVEKWAVPISTLGVEISFALSILATDQQAAAAYTYTVTVQSSNSGNFFRRDANPGHLFAVELA